MLFKYSGVLPVLKAISCANWDPQALWKIIIGGSGRVLQNKTVLSEFCWCHLWTDKSQRQAGGPRIFNISKCVILTLVSEAF